MKVFLLNTGLAREGILYSQPTGPNPLIAADDFSGPALRYGSLKLLLFGSLISTFLMAGQGADEGVSPEAWASHPPPFVARQEVCLTTSLSVPLRSIWMP